MLPNNHLKVVIPARYASSRLPGKPLVDLCGQPMIIRVANQVRKAIPHADIWVATDDKRIENVVAESGHQVMLTGLDHESGTDRIAELVDKLGWSEDSTIINVQGDEPLIDIGLLQKFSEFCVNDSNLSMASVMAPLDGLSDINDPNVVKVTTNKNGHAMTFSRSPLPFFRDVPLESWPIDFFKRHVGIYAYRGSLLKILSTSEPCEIEKIEKLEQLRALWLGHSISMMNWKNALHAGVDSKDDVTRVRKILTTGITE